MYRGEMIERAQALRSNATVVEQRLWAQLRARKLGVKFRRQHPIGPYIADFACVRARLVVEIDGETHTEAYDEHRDRWLESRGWRVMHVTLEEIDRGVEDVAATIQVELDDPHTMLTYWQRSGLTPSTGPFRT